MPNADPGQERPLRDRRCLRRAIVPANRRRADEPTRFAVEDYLGAGAILSTIKHDLSPEARVSAAAFERSQGDVLELLLDCASGRQLHAWGLEDDARFAAQIDVCGTVPLLQDGRYVGL